MKHSLQSPSLCYAIQSFDETGAMRAPYLLLKGFAQAGWKTEIVTMASEANANLERVWQSVPLVKMEGGSKNAKLFRLASHFVGKHQQQLVITWIWDWHGYGLIASHLLFGSKYIVVLDTYSHRAFGTSRNKRWQALRYGPLLRHASLILAEAPACREAVLQHLPQANVLLVPSSLWRSDLEAIEQSWQREGWQPHRKPVILYAGRLVERKNVHRLIEAFARVATRFPDWSVEIIGPEVSQAYAQQLHEQVAKYQLEQRISFLPGLSGEALYRKYRTSSIYALPSEGEGFPTSILEAMYFGGAIIAGNSGYVAYQLEGECGLLHTPHDVDQLVAHLQTLMASEAKRVEIMQRARQRLLERFTWEQHFPLLEAKFRELLGA
ncbi:MAG: glycosyltransferase family 4 protein [Caldilineaceae bacterium]